MSRSYDPCIHCVYDPDICIVCKLTQSEYNRVIDDLEAALTEKCEAGREMREKYDSEDEMIEKESQPSPQQEPSVWIRWHGEVFSGSTVENKYSAEYVPKSQLLKAEAELERERIRLAACGVAAMQNTKDSRGKNQVDKDSPYYSASYADVCAAIDREMSLMVQLKASEEREEKLRCALKEIIRNAYMDETEEGKMDYDPHPCSLARLAEKALGIEND